MRWRVPVEQFCTSSCIPDRLAVEAHGLVVRRPWLSVELFEGAPLFSSALPMISSRNFSHLAVLLVCTALEISQFRFLDLGITWKSHLERVLFVYQDCCLLRKEGVYLSDMACRNVLGSRLDQGASEELLADPDVPG